MPGKKKGEKSVNPKIALKKISTNVLKSIWNQINIPDWMSVVRTAYPTNQWTSTRKGLKGRCPFHDDKDPSFNIDLERQHAKCFSPDCGKYFWDPIRFYAQVQDLEYVAALREMKDRFDLAIPQKTLNEISNRYEHREMKRVLYTVMNGELCDAYALMHGQSALPQDFIYAQNCLRYLHHRNIPAGHYHLLPIGVLPNQQRLEHLLHEHARIHNSLDYWEKAKAYLSWALEGSSWLGSLVFFTGDSPTDPCKIKLRKLPQYINGTFSTIEPKEVRFFEDNFEESNGIFGLFGTPAYQPYMARTESVPFFYVEGEFDALSIISRQCQTGQIGYFVFSGGGSSASGLDCLLAHGHNLGYVVGDCDAPGDEWAGNVLKNTGHLPARIFVWPDSLKTNPLLKDKKLDPDCVVVNCGFETFNTELLKTENFILPQAWAYDRAIKAMAAISPDDIRHLTNVAATWGGYVKDSAEQHAYIEAVTQKFDINAGQVKSGICAADPNEESYIARIKDGLINRLHVLQKVKENNAYILRCWDKVSKGIVDLPVGDKTKIIAAINFMTGKDTFKWLHEDVGDPGWLTTYEEAIDSHNLIRTENLLKDYVVNGVSRMASHLPVSSEMRFVGTGFHCVAPDIDPQAEEGTVRGYLVNGLDMYRAEYDDAGNLTWHTLPGPSDQHVVIKADTGDKPRIFLPHIRNIADLNKEPQLCAEEIYDRLLSMLLAGWEFKNPLVTAQFLASLIMAIPISNFGIHQSMTLITADPSSGKTCLLGGFIGRSAMPRINVLYPTLFMDTYTPAGVKMSMNGSTLCLCLDEYEDKGDNDRKTQQIRGVQSLLRNMANEECSITQGTTNGKSQTFILRHMVIAAAIRTPTDPADITRYNMVELIRNSNHESPGDILPRDFGEEKITQIRQELPLVMYRLARKYYEAFKEVREEFRSGADLIHGGVTRSRENIYPNLAVLKVIKGTEYAHQFARDYFSTNRRNIEQISAISVSSEIWSNLLFTPAVYTQDVDDPRPKTVDNVLSSGNPEMLNTSNSGVYYDKVNGWLVVNWATALATIMSKARIPIMLTVLSVKTQCARHTYAISDDTVLRSDVLDRLRPFIGNHANIQHISVFNLKTVAIDTQQKHEIAPARGLETHDLMPEYEEALSRRIFPKPDAPAKKDEKDGKSSSNANPQDASEDEAPKMATATKGKKSIDDFDY